MLAEVELHDIFVTGLGRTIDYFKEYIHSLDLFLFIEAIIGI